MIWPFSLLQRRPRVDAEDDRLIFISSFGQQLAAPLGDILEVTFFKRRQPRPEVTCCELFFLDDTYTMKLIFHSRIKGFDEAITLLEGLEGFDPQWREQLKAAKTAGGEPARILAYTKPKPTREPATPPASPEPEAPLGGGA